MHTSEEKALVLQWLVWTASWDFKAVKKVMGWCTAQQKMLLFCVKIIVKVSRKFELARLKKERKKTFFFVWQLSGLVLIFRDFFCATRSLEGHENTWIWIVCCYKSFQILMFWDFERFYCIILYCVFMLSLHVESTDSLITKIRWHACIY